MEKWFKKWGTPVICIAMFLFMIVFMIMFGLNGKVALPGRNNATTATEPSDTQTPDNSTTIIPPANTTPDKNISSYISLGMFSNFGVVGDSYATGAIYVMNDDDTLKSVGIYEKLAWGNILANKLGTQCTNFSHGGLSTRTWLTDPHGLTALLAAEPQDIYYLMLGINDKKTYGANNIGSIDDIKDDFLQNADTFYGNYGKIICYIKMHAPDAKIMISTMTGTTDLNKLYNDAIEELADHFGIPCIKQYEHPFFNSDFYRKNLVASHPTAPLYAAMASALEELFQVAIYDNYDYFKDYIG